VFRRRRLIAGVIAAVLALTIVLSAVVPILQAGDSGPDTPATRPVTTVQFLPDVSLSTLDGATVPMASLAGQPTVINYWFSTCPPCEAEMPALAAVAAEYEGRVRFVGVNTQDPPDTARSFAAAKGVTYEQLLDRTGRSVDAFALTRMPSTVFVTERGVVALVEQNPVTEKTLRAFIEEFLAP
jgi:thiol-disulfide isomerase/thioredoxin